MEKLETELDEIPEQFAINNLYPNPFNPVINFNIRIKNPDRVNISIIDILGRNINNLYKGTMVSGNYNFSWDGNNAIGKQVSSGTYFLVVSNNYQTLVEKMLYLK